MQRWKHAGRGPKSTLIVGILLGVASLVLYNSAYAAATGPYPGSIALPGIPNGPRLGCTPTSTAHQTWVCGFNQLSNTHFLVNGRDAGGFQADSNGCVLLTLYFSQGEVSVNNNKPVATHVGINYLIIKGHKTTATGTVVVGLRIAFQVPHGTAQRCKGRPVGPPTTSTTQRTGPPTSSSTTTFPKRHRFPRFTTTTNSNPTTLAKVIETPLEISPNRVILMTSLLSAVLAALLSAGALGSIWNAEATAATAGATSGPAAPDDAGGPSAPGDGGGPSSPGEGDGPSSPGEGGVGPAGGTPPAPEPPPAPAPPAAAPSEAFVPPVTNAFTRTNLRRPHPGGGP
ncbi:MAG TPA: hypothetical protein VGZ03_04840 [Acidimicrobiales bacterium]|jgi:hypothetical protein|nr:hypothetical protein [Acidimicrobiales bacterium]